MHVPIRHSTSARAAVVVLAAMLTLAACTKAPEIPEPPAASEVEESAAPGADEPVQMPTADAIVDALKQLSKAVGTDDPQVTSVSVYPEIGSVIIEAIDPAAPTELNAWTFRDGEVGDPRVLDYLSTSTVEALDANLFALSEVSVQVLADVAAAAVEESGVEDGVLEYVNAKRGTPFTDAIQINALVSSDRESRVVKADLTGQVLEVI